MSILFKSPSVNATGSPKYTQMNVQSSAYGLAIPLVYGTTRLGDNLLDYQNFQAIQVNNDSSSGGGKGGVVGGGGKGGGSGGTTDYYADVLCALCEGPIAGVPNSWSSQTLQGGTPGFDVFGGSAGQAPWSYWQDNYPGNAIGYSSTAYVGAASYSLGTSANLPNLNFEVQALLAGTAPSTYGGNGCVAGGDADPSQVVPDILTNGQYGLGFPSNRIGQVTSNDEAHSVPGSPYQVQVNNPSQFLFNINVVDTVVDGVGTNLYTCVPLTKAPGPYEYNFNPANGVYTFNAAQAGVTVNIRYASLGALSTYQAWCMAAGLWISPAYTDQTQASSMLDDIGTGTYAEFVWSSGVLTLVPRATAAVSGNGYTYNPPSQPLFDLGIDDFLPNTNPTGTVSASANDDPVIVTRQRASDQLNDIKIEALDRANQYAPTIVEATDQALIDKYGRRASAPKSLHMFCDIGAANVSAQLQLQDQYIRNNYSITLDARYVVLDPMDLVTLTDPDYPDMDEIPVRVLTVTENDDGTLSITLEDYLGNLGVAAEYNLNTGSGIARNFNEDPGPVNAPVLFAYPISLAQNQGLAVGAAVSGTNPGLYGGCQVWISSQEAGPYRYLGQMTSAARMGVTTADFPAGIDPDTTDTLSVDLTESDGTLSSGTQSDADQGNTSCLVRGASGDEWVSYETATLTSANKYNLGGYLRRGLYSSTILDHPSGSPFVRLDDIIFQIPYQASQIGQTVYLKFAAFNIYGGGVESLGTVTAYPIVLPQPPAPPAVTGFSAEQVGGAVAFSWNPVNYPQVALAGYLIGYAPAGTTDWSLFNLLSEVAAGSEMTNASVPPGNWVFGIRAVNVAYSPGSQNGLSALTTTTLLVTNPSSIIYQQDEAPGFVNRLDGLWRSWAAELVPESSVGAASLTNAQLFEQYVPSPIPLSAYTTSTIDISFNDTPRVYAEEIVLAGRGVTGAPNVNLQLDTWQDGGSDQNEWVDWNIGTPATAFRYARLRLLLENSAAQAYISDFQPTIDKSPVIENVSSVTVSAGGSRVTFPNPFHNIPDVITSAAGSGISSASATSVDTHGFTGHAWTGSSDSGGQITYAATGV